MHGRRIPRRWSTRALALRNRVAYRAGMAEPLSPEEFWTMRTYLEGEHVD